ncbi:MAG: c-type cytochrome [Acidobacteria bacterium]|nr:c-type cytochrome [Acidobacteriota bacterium]MDA1237248.1 c-type cytochrome [Acidobacteriota bacterium]
MNTLLKIACSVALTASLWGQIQPKVEGHESPADVARRAVEGERATASAPQNNPFESEQDIQKGDVLFQTHCSNCHGTFGAGGRGADLTTGLYRFGGSDAELYRTIRNGIPGSEMGPPQVNDDDLWRLAAFVKRLGLAPPEDAPGDAAEGKVVYLTAGCGSCHSINGQGGTLGPDLSDVGRRRGLAFLEESLLKPEADLPTNHRGTRLLTSAGETIAGIRLNEDDYSIQIRDTSGNPRSFLKHELKGIQRDDPSLMPAYGSLLSEKQIEDLTAYLATLKGMQ